MEPLTLRVGLSLYKDMQPACLEKLLKNRFDDCEPGMELEMLRTVADYMNVGLKIEKISNELGCGWYNGTAWTGLFGMLERDEIDVTGNLCMVMEGRAGEFEASWPVLQHRQSFLIKKPSIEYQFNMMAPFRLTVWLTLITIAISVFFMNFLFLRFRTRGKLGITWKCIFTSFFFSNYSSYDRKLEIPPMPLRLASILCLQFASIFYSAYIALVVLNPVVKHRPFSNQIELADSLLKGEYRLLDYHKGYAVTPQCYSDEMCKKFREAINLYGYEYAIQGDSGAYDYGLDQLVRSENLVMVNTAYWLELYADHFDGPRSELWLIDDDLSGQKWYSFFRRRNTTFSTRFDEALIGMGDFKYYLPELYLGLARYIFRGKYFRGPLPERYVIDLKTACGPIKLYAVGVTLAIVIFCIEHVIGNMIKRRKCNIS